MEVEVADGRKGNSTKEKRAVLLEREKGARKRAL